MRNITIVYKILSVFMLMMLISCMNKGNSGKSKNNNIQEFLDKPGDYRIENNIQNIVLDFELFSGNKPMISGEIQGKEVRFLIDNGKLFNEIWFYNGEVDSIGLHYQSEKADSLIGIGANSASQIFEGNLVSVDFQNIQFVNQPTLISPKEAGYASFFPGINGQVSSMLFKHFIVKFNFTESEIILLKTANFIKSENTSAVKMRKRENGSYCIPFKLKMRDGDFYNLLLDIDIGTVFPLYIISNSGNNIPVSLEAEKQFLGYGASGELFGYKDTILEVSFGNFRIENHPAMIVKAENNVDTSIVESGTFGIELMKQFNVTFDYFNEIIYFEPNESFSGDIKTDF